METPKTLMAAIQFFGDPDHALRYFASKRWPNGVTCPYCDADTPMFLQTRRIWKCRKCRKQFSAKVGTIFEDSPLPLGKWLTTAWLIGNCKNGVSSYEIARDIKVTQKSAWFMLHRLRRSMQDPYTGGKLAGEVEVDETFVGGKARNMHVAKRRKKIFAPGPHSKAIVAAVLERGGRVKAAVVSKRRKHQLHELVRANVEPGSALYSDALQAYDGLKDDYLHQVVDHAECYVEGQVHTNGLENFWSLLKRGLGGTYISVEPFHLFRYIDEQSFRYNNRKMTDAERFDLAVRGIVGKRITYDRLTGKEADGRTRVN